MDDEDNVVSVDDWPTDEDMAEMCGCNHTLGQHSYGIQIAPCEQCPCQDFHSPFSCKARASWGGPSRTSLECARHLAERRPGSIREVRRRTGCPIGLCAAAVDEHPADLKAAIRAACEAHNADYRRRHPGVTFIGGVPEGALDGL